MGLKVVVTGASSGIGRGTALRFSKDGHEVYGTGRSAKKLEETARLSREAGGAEVFSGVGDVGVEADVDKNYAEAVKVLKGVPNIVVLNAGVSFPSPLEQYTNDEYDEIFNANVRGVFLWLKAILPDFKKRGSGQIVIINSICGDSTIAPNLSLYIASKFAVNGLAQSVRSELRGSGIKVGSVFPGIVDTEIFEGPVWAKKGIDNVRELFQIEKIALSVNDVVEAVTTIAYQSPRSDIDKLSVFHSNFEPVSLQRTI